MEENARALSIGRIPFCLCVCVCVRVRSVGFINVFGMMCVLLARFSTEVYMVLIDNRRERRRIVGTRVSVYIGGKKVDDEREGV